MSSRVHRRKARKARNRLLNGAQTLTKTQLEYLKLLQNAGTSLHPELIINSIDLIGFQEMILWVLSDFVNPRWFCIRHKPLVSRMALIMVNNLRDHHLSSLPDSNPFSSATRLPITLPTSRYNDNAVLQSILYYRDASKKALAAYRKAHENDEQPEKKTKRDLPSASHYILNPKQLIENRYPSDAFDNTWRIGPSDPELESERLLAIDCEMCTTEQGLELARVSVVDEHGVVLYDSFVMPGNSIVNYNTEYSGITEETLQGVTTRLRDVQEKILEIIGSDRPILVGHSLENDLHAIKLVYDRIIDTAIIYPHRQPPYKCSLRFLAKKHLDEIIQQGSHDSCVDARIAMSLALLKIRKGPSFGVPCGPRPMSMPLLSIVSKHERKIAMIDEPSYLKEFATGSVSAIHLSGNGVSQTINALGEHDLVLGRWRFDLDAGRQELMSSLEQLHNRIPPYSLVVVTSGGGLSAEYQRLLELRIEHIRAKKIWSDDNDLLLRQAMSNSGNGVALFMLTSPVSSSNPS